MSYEVYRLIFYIGAALAGVFVLTAAVLFFTLKIPALIGELTGATARKAIANINSQSQNSKDNEQAIKPRQKRSDRFSASGRLLRETGNVVAPSVMTSKINTKQLEAEAQQAYETTLLSPQADETTILSDGRGETTLLDGDQAISSGFVPQTGSAVFEIEQEITFVHSDEVVE